MLRHELVSDSRNRPATVLLKNDVRGIFAIHSLDRRKSKVGKIDSGKQMFAFALDNR